MQDARWPRIPSAGSHTFLIGPEEWPLRPSMPLPDAIRLRREQQTGPVGTHITRQRESQMELRSESGTMGLGDPLGNVRN